MDHFHRFHRYCIRRIAPSENVERDSLIYWRANILFGVISVGLFTGLFAIAASVHLAAKFDLWVLPLTGIAAWLAGLFLLVSKRPAYELRAAIITLLFFIIGVSVMVFIGPLSGGPIYLFSFAVFSGILLGLVPALFAIAFNTATITIILWLIHDGVIAKGFPFFLSKAAMIAAGANFIVLNTIVAISVAVLVKGLHQIHLNEKTLTENLAREQQRLLTAKRNLEREAEERFHAEESLRESEKNFRELAEMLPETVFEMDIDGTLTFVNRSAFDQFGYTAADFENGLNALDMIATEDRPKVRENVQKLLSGEDTGISEYRALRKNGTSFVGLFKSAPKLQGGKVTGIRGFIVDITDKKRLEAQLLQSQKMEAIGTLAGGIAHDFNNILAPIIGFAEICIADIPPENIHHKNIQQILSAALRARDLVKQILAFSRHSGQEKKPVHLHLVVGEAMKLLKASIPSSITISQNITTESMVYADPTQMHQIIMNLCTNAYHAMEDDSGELTISLSDIEIDDKNPAISAAMRPGTYIRLSVRDTGCGIEADLLERIFEPYYTTKQKDKGTGMGLSVVHGIVKEHDGHIITDSIPGFGSTFHVYLPVLATDLHQPAETCVSSLPRGREHILLVDDETAVAQVMHQVLSRLGYQVTCHTSSRSLLDEFQRDPDRFDLVITDYTMPKMTGVELVMALKKSRADIPVILCTGYSEKMTPEIARQLGILQILIKPIEQTELATAVRRALDHQGG